VTFRRRTLIRAAWTLRIARSLLAGPRYCRRSVVIGALVTELAASAWPSRRSLQPRRSASRHPTTAHRPKTETYPLRARSFSSASAACDRRAAALVVLPVWRGRRFSRKPELDVERSGVHVADAVLVREAAEVAERPGVEALERGPRIGIDARAVAVVPVTIRQAFEVEKSLSRQVGEPRHAEMKVIDGLAGAATPSGNADLLSATHDVSFLHGERAEVRVIGDEAFRVLPRDVVRASRDRYTFHAGLSRQGNDELAGSESSRRRETELGRARHRCAARLRALERREDWSVRFIASVGKYLFDSVYELQLRDRGSLQARSIAASNCGALAAD
jgi:hypothetical protein